MADDAVGPGVGDGAAIQQVSELLGVPAPTLRSWERRYGLPTTQRSPGGHRRYSEEALHQLRLMRDKVARGRRAADAARTVRSLLGQEGPGVALVNALLAASEQMDPGGVRAVLDQAHEELGLGGALDEVMMPAMRQVGSWWAAGRCNVAQEHLTTEVARGWLARLTALAPAPTNERPVILACGPRDLHTLGLEGLAALLAHHPLPPASAQVRPRVQALFGQVRTPTERDGRRAIRRVGWPSGVHNAMLAPARPQRRVERLFDKPETVGS